MGDIALSGEDVEIVERWRHQTATVETTTATPFGDFGRASVHGSNAVRYDAPALRRRHSSRCSNN